MINESWGEWVNYSDNPMVVIRSIEEARQALLQGYAVSCGSEAVTWEMLDCAEENKLDLEEVIRLAQVKDYEKNIADKNSYT
jgi:hypothetical protein